METHTTLLPTSYNVSVTDCQGLIFTSKDITDNITQYSFVLTEENKETVSSVALNNG